MNVEQAQVKVRDAKRKVALDWVGVVAFVAVAWVAVYVDLGVWTIALAIIIAFVGAVTIILGVLPDDDRALKEAEETLWIIRWEAKL